MIPKPINTESLLLVAKSSNLYQDLVVQLQKDFETSGLSFEVSLGILPLDLVDVLKVKLAHLIQNNFDGFLQFLYRVDVSEQALLSSSLKASEDIVTKATFLILQREWQKVYYRKEFS